MKNVSVIGMGYIGLPTATLIANHGFKVFGMDKVERVVATINRGEIHIVEPGLAAYVKKAVTSGNLHADTKPHEADVFILAVPTPFKGDKEPDLSYVEAATREVAPYVKEGNLIVLESTSPVGTTEKVQNWLLEERADLVGKKLYFAHCPERVLPGKIVEELPHNDRIIGGVDKESTDKTIAFYGHFVTGALLATDARTAELSKLTENSFRDVNIAFANELSVICEKLGVDVWELIRLANRHPRVNILQPGPGVGGHCIAVDPWFIVDSAPKEARLIRVAREVNDSKPHIVLEKVYAAARKMDAPKIACLGLAFKPDIDDLRESPSLKIAEILADSNPGELLAVEPNIHELPAGLANKMGVKLVSLDEAMQQANIVLLLVDHKEFKQMDRKLLEGKTVIDTRGIFA
ncbi:UDP-N-acetyl-D-mannosamine dehydrogenase [Mitsuokella sp. oral taxon 131]|uniref:UDP-N-acetyl-D-mannosamine dehydrogenase n=1 Tax=Mitsuokella sp. oral taxon 131 TaxID=1321780 RepID=UPI0003AD7AD3|nr:UDP-N-acetyl-D-mannosamine dehydrogenase [Mitsuokella sp. oral taxon 131]ERL03713.1 nucleotide sugar dehydrogenase [Mitsuokella sp. oral taxon 131 str. W9106]